MKNRVMHGTAAVVLGLTVFALVGCHAEEHGHEQAGTFAVTTPLRRDTALERDYVAQVHAIQHIELRALERGYLQDIFVDEGSRVTEGQRMFQIMPLVYQAEVNIAVAETELATIEYSNTEALAKKSIVSGTELALAKAKLSKARAHQALAETHKQLTTLRAPFEGLMGRLHVRRGSLLEEGELLTTISDNSQLWVYFNVTEREYLDYVSQPAGERPSAVKLIMANGEVFAEEGAITAIEADFDNETGNIAFRATFPNPQGLLRHGETGKVLMSIPFPGALQIPQKATFEILDRLFVFVVDPDGVLRTREITVAAELPNLFVIGSGLEETDRILLEGLRKVHDGQKIAVEMHAPSEVLAHLDLPAE